MLQAVSVFAILTAYNDCHKVEDHFGHTAEAGVASACIISDVFDSNADWALGGAAGSAHNNTASSQNTHSNSHPERQTGSARATSAQPHRTASVPISEHSPCNSLPQDLRPVLWEAYREVRQT